MRNAPRPDNEKARIEALRRYNILDTLPEAAFDDLTRLAAHICGTSLSLITLIDEERQWIKSAHGMQPREFPRDEALCSYTILGKDILLVEDTTQDERFRDNPLVTGLLQVRFYAGMPLRSHAGHNLGTLCVIDRQSRCLSADQKEALRILAHQVMSQIELRRHLVELERTFFEHRRIQDALKTSERFYETLVESLPQNILRKDTQGRFTFANEKFARSLGQPLKQIMGKTDWDLFPKHLADKYHRDDERVMSSGQPIDTIEANQTPAGDKIFVHVIKTPLVDSTGKVVGIQGIFWDVTERKKIEEALAYERDLLRALLDNIPDRIYFKDVNSRFLRCSSSMAKRLGCSDPTQVIGKTDFDFYPKELADGFFQDEQRVILTGQPLVNKLEKVEDADGQEFWVSVTKVPIYNQNGSVTGLIGISRDVTKLKEAEAALEHARDVALETARVKSEFLANMSHEIRTPMNAITGMTGLLLDTALNQEQREFAETISSSTENLLGIINDILDFSKIEAGKLSLEIIDFNLRDVVEGTAEMLAEKAQSKGVELACWIEEDVPTRLRGDPGRIRQVLANLLSNAVKFTERGEVVVRVTKQDEIGDKVSLRISVNDTGIGIPQKALPLIFQAFTQADGSTTRRYGGTGLGLAISRQLMELMEGRLEVESTLGKGSTFSFTVSLQKQAAAEQISDAPAIKELSNLHVLVVDDNATNRFILQRQTSRWGIRTDEVASGPDALSALRVAHESGNPYDLVLLDMQMPDMDGLTFAQTLANDPSLPHPQIIMLTSLGHRLDQSTMAAAGISLCLIKPVKESRLFDSLATVMDGSLTEPSKGHSVTPAEVSLTGSPPTFANVRILLAEDNAVNQKLALRQLKKLGYLAQPVSNGYEVLNALEREHFDIILMDCQMPEIDGYEVTKRIRESRRDRPPSEQTKPYIIALTANALEGDREHCLAVGMNDYITKPVRLPDLQAALSRAVQGQNIPIREGTNGKVSGGEVLDPSIIAGLKELREPGQPDPVAELVDLFIKDAHPRLERIASAASTENAAQLVAAAHSLKGSASNLGARCLASLCAELETLGKIPSWAEIRTLVPQLESQLHQVEDKLQKEVAK